MIDLDLFLERDIPIFLDGYEPDIRSAASEQEINGLLASKETSTGSGSSSGASAGQVSASGKSSTIDGIDVDTRNITINANAITIQTDDGPSTHISHDGKISREKKASQKKDSSSKNTSANAKTKSSSQPPSDTSGKPLAAKKPEKPKQPLDPRFDEKIVETVEQGGKDQEKQFYMQAIQNLESGDVRKARSLLYALLKKNPRSLVYKRRLADALRSSEKQSTDAPLPNASKELSRTASSLSSSEEKTTSLTDTQMNDKQPLLEKEVPQKTTLKTTDSQSEEKSISSSLSQSNRVSKETSTEEQSSKKSSQMPKKTVPLSVIAGTKLQDEKEPLSLYDNARGMRSYKKVSALIKHKQFATAEHILVRLAKEHPENVAIQVRLEQVRENKGEINDY